VIHRSQPIIQANLIANEKKSIWNQIWQLQCHIHRSNLINEKCYFSKWITMLKFNARKSRSYGITLIKRKSHTTWWQVSAYQETISILNQSTLGTETSDNDPTSSWERPNEVFLKQSTLGRWAPRKCPTSHS